MSFYLVSVCYQAKIKRLLQLSTHFPHILAIGGICYAVLMLWVKSHWFALLIPLDLAYTYYRLHHTSDTLPVSRETKPTQNNPSPVVTIKSPPQIIANQQLGGVVKPTTTDFTSKYKPSHMEINDTLKYTVQNLGI